MIYVEYGIDDVVVATHTSVEGAAIAGAVAIQTTQEELEARQRVWRDAELTRTDWIVPMTDHSGRPAHIEYRSALRAWPTTDDFPVTRPTL